jgi:hypothetical protein
MVTVAAIVSVATGAGAIGAGASVLSGTCSAFG